MLNQQNFYSGYDSPVHLGEQKFKDKLQFTPHNIQSPQPCVSPSSLINALYDGEEQGFSAPLYNDYPLDINSFGSQSSKKKSNSKDSNNKKSSGVKKEEAKKPTVTTGLFNYNWDSEDDDNENPSS
jgi:hypothetical protein